MAAYHLRKLREVEEAEDQREARLEGAENRKPLTQILQALPEPEPFKRRAF